MPKSEHKSHLENLYLRNILLPEIGEAGQKKLGEARVLVVGAGGLGSAALFYLTAAGIGKIGIIDDDVVEISNLQRQIIHNFEDLEKKKVVSASHKLLLLNPYLELEIFDKRADEKNLTEICAGYDLILDATDNFHSRFLINSIAHKSKKTLIFAAVKGFVGQISVFKSFLPNNPCYCCFNPNFSDEEFQIPLSQKGILGSVAGSVGSMQATIAIKEILSISESLIGKILFCDFLKNDFRKSILKKNPDCKICSH